MQIIDAGMLAFAAFHALKGKVPHPLTFQVPRMLRAMLAESPDAYALCWNAARLRKDEMWPAYRDRPEIWEEAGAEDFDAMLRVLSALGAVQYRADGWEADEEIAALVHRFEGTRQIRIRSDDKDFFQLLSGSTRMIGRRRGLVRYSDVKEKMGVTPAFAADFQALTGDPVDGIPRILPPAASKKLLATRGHVRDWIDRDLRVEAGIKWRLEESREQLRLNLALVDLSEAAVGPPPAPLLDGWGDLEVAREAGRRLEITFLQADDVADQFAVLRRCGQETRRLLGV
jgi:5'-3' exonuclease